MLYCFDHGTHMDFVLKKTGGIAMDRTQDRLLGASKALLMTCPQWTARAFPTRPVTSWSVDASMIGEWWACCEYLPGLSDFQKSDIGGSLILGDPQNHRFQD